MKNSVSTIQSAESIYMSSSIRDIERVSRYVGALVAASSIAL